MALRVVHPYVNPLPDAPLEDGEFARPSDWNADHVVEGAGSAAEANVEDFATAAQGTKADSAVQPGDLASVATSGAYPDLSGTPTLGTAAAADTGDFATAVQGALADTAVQPAAIREKLTANRTYYVATTGDDSTGDGSSGNPWRTIGKALAVAVTLDLAGFTLTIQLADGTYAENVLVPRCVGQASAANLVIQGNATTPGNVIISGGAGRCIAANAPGAACLVKDMRLNGASSSSGTGIRADAGAVVTFANIEFGAASIQVLAYVGGVVIGVGDYKIVGSAAFNLLAAGGIIDVNEGVATITLTGTPAFGVAFAGAQRNGLIEISATFSGSATGARYNCAMGGGVYTNAGGATYLPGNAAGTATSPGWYG